MNPSLCFPPNKVIASDRYIEVCLVIDECTQSRREAQEILKSAQSALEANRRKQKKLLKEEKKRLKKKKKATARAARKSRFYNDNGSDEDDNDGTSSSDDSSDGENGGNDGRVTQPVGRTLEELQAISFAANEMEQLYAEGLRKKEEAALERKSIKVDNKKRGESAYGIVIFSPLFLGKEDGSRIKRKKE